MMATLTPGDIALIVVICLFFARIAWTLERLLNMHLNADKHGFGTEATNALLEKHMSREKDMHAATISIMRELTRTTRELSYYIQWSTKQQTGKKAPPYVNKGIDHGE